MRFLFRFFVALLFVWLVLFAVASLHPKVGGYILIRADERAVFYAAHPELSTEIIFQGAGLLLYRVLSED